VESSASKFGGPRELLLAVGFFGFVLTLYASFGLVVYLGIAALV